MLTNICESIQTFAFIWTLKYFYIQGWMGWQLPHGPRQPGCHLHHPYFHRFDDYDDDYDDVYDDVDDDDDADDDHDENDHQVAQANDYSLSREVTNHLFQGLLK